MMLVCLRSRKSVSRPGGKRCNELLDHHTSGAPRSAPGAPRTAAARGVPSGRIEKLLPARGKRAANLAILKDQPGDEGERNREDPFATRQGGMEPRSRTAQGCYFILLKL